MLRFAKVATSATRIPVRSLAKKAVPKAAASGPQTSASAPADLTAVVHGLNIMKEGADPAIRPDSEYPEWVWTLCAASNTAPEPFVVQSFGGARAPLMRQRFASVACPAAHFPLTRHYTACAQA